MTLGAFTLGFLFGWFLRWPKQRARTEARRGAPSTYWYSSGESRAVAQAQVRQQRGDR